MNPASLSAATILTSVLVGGSALVGSVHPAILRTFVMLFSSMLGNGVSVARAMRHAGLYLVMLFFWLWLVGVTAMVFFSSLFSHLLLAADAIMVAVLFTGALRKIRYVLARHPPRPSPTAWRLTRKQVYNLRSPADIMRISLRLFPVILWYLALPYLGVILIMATPVNEPNLAVVAGFSACAILPFAGIALSVNRKRARLVYVLQWTDTHQRLLYSLQALLLISLGGVLVFFVYDTFTVVQWIVGQVPY